MAGDKYGNIEGLIGSASGDWLIGDAGNNYLSGRHGDDTLEGGAGADKLDDEEGFDFASYEHASRGVTASLSPGAIKTNDAQGDTYFNIEGLIGSDFGDVLYADASGTILKGLGGNDNFYAYTAGDKTVGETTLEGGGGDDVYWMADPDTKTIVEAAGGGNDKIIVSGSFFSLANHPEVENLTAGVGEMHLVGNGKDNVLEASGGTGDTLEGEQAMTPSKVTTVRITSMVARVLIFLLVDIPIWIPSTMTMPSLG